MQAETAIRIADSNEGKVDVFQQNKTPSSGRASTKSWQYRWVAVYPANAPTCEHGCAVYMYVVVVKYLF